MGTTVEQETAMREALLKERNEASIKAKAHRPLKVDGKAFFRLNASSASLAASNARD